MVGTPGTLLDIDGWCFATCLMLCELNIVYRVPPSFDAQIGGYGDGTVVSGRYASADRVCASCVTVDHLISA